jgi:hypothetical protein
MIASNAARPAIAHVEVTINWSGGLEPRARASR